MLRTSCDRHSCLRQPACVGGSVRVRHTAGAAEHASEALSTLNEPRLDRTRSGASACHTLSTTLAHRQRCASLDDAVRVGGSVGGRVGGEGGRAWASSQAAAYGWCCSARSTDALHAERTHGSITHAAERVRATRQHRHPCPPCQRCASLDGAMRVGGRVGGEVGRACASCWAAAYCWCCSARISATLRAERALGSIGHAEECPPLASSHASVRRPSHTTRSGAHASTNRACGCSRA